VNRQWSPTARDQLTAKAMKTVHQAIKRGLLPELDGLKCMDCNEPATCYDHRNYFEPMKVDPVCKGCNNRRGPGYPPLSAGDGEAYKKSPPKGADTAGYKWGSVEGGEGYCPPDLPIHVALDWTEVEEAANDRDRQQNSGFRRAVRTFSAMRGGVRTARYEYFKARDPWAIDMTSDMDAA
jgi:hypothetical protein